MQSIRALAYGICFEPGKHIIIKNKSSVWNVFDMYNGRTEELFDQPLNTR